MFKQWTFKHEEKSRLETKITKLEEKLVHEQRNLHIEKSNDTKNEVNNINYILKPNVIIIFNSYHVIVLES